MASYHCPADPNSTTGQWVDFAAMNKEQSIRHAAKRGLVKLLDGGCARLVRWSPHSVKSRCETPNGRGFTVRRSHIVAAWAEPAPKPVAS